MFERHKRRFLKETKSRDLTQQRYSWLELHLVTIHIKNEKINKEVL